MGAVDSVVEAVSDVADAIGGAVEGILDDPLTILSMIPGPQQPFLLAANAVKKASEGNIIGAIASAYGAYSGFTAPSVEEATAAFQSLPADAQQAYTAAGYGAQDVGTAMLRDAASAEAAANPSWFNLPEQARNAYTDVISSVSEATGLSAGAVGRALPALGQTVLSGGDLTQAIQNMITSEIGGMAGSQIGTPTGVSQVDQFLRQLGGGTVSAGLQGADNPLAAALPGAVGGAVQRGALTGLQGLSELVGTPDFEKTSPATLLVGSKLFPEGLGMRETTWLQANPELLQPLWDLSQSDPEKAKSWGESLKQNLYDGGAAVGTTWGEGPLTTSLQGAQTAGQWWDVANNPTIMSNWTQIPETTMVSPKTLETAFSVGEAAGAPVWDPRFVQNLSTLGTSDLAFVAGLSPEAKKEYYALAAPTEAQKQSQFAAALQQQLAGNLGAQAAGGVKSALQEEVAKRYPQAQPTTQTTPSATAPATAQQGAIAQQLAARQTQEDLLGSMLFAPSTAYSEMNKEPTTPLQFAVGDWLGIA